jgi:hypothetical protein
MPAPMIRTSKSVGCVLVMVILRGRTPYMPR